MANDRDTGGGRTGGPHETLVRIADALGQPRSAFYDGGSAETDLAGLIALVRAWDGLRREEDREQVLALARALAAADAPEDQHAE